MFNYQKLLKRSLAVLLATGGCSALMGQSVIDPSAENENYEVEKAALVAQVAAPTPIRPVRSLAAPMVMAAAASTNSSYIPVDASYTALPRNDDGSFGPVSLPFAFNLYGSNYSNLYINTNGNITFTDAYSAFNATGFPFDMPMIAPFWADVDTRTGGMVHYKLTSTEIIITWNAVGYFDTKTDKLNSFQVILTNGNSPLIGIGNNIKFNYMDMQWTTGNNVGYGGNPATVGVNKGDGTNYVQIGRFDKLTSDYDGPGGANDGVNYLDYQSFSLNVSNAQNIEPASSGFPVSNILRLNVGQSATLQPRFIGPEVGQSVTTTVNTGGLCGTTYTVTNGVTSAVDMQIVGQLCNVGTHHVVFSATDNGVPAKTTNVDLTVVVENPCLMTINGYSNIATCYGASNGSINITPINGNAPYTYSWSNGAVSEDIRNLTAGTYTVTVTDAFQCVSVAQFPVNQPSMPIQAQFDVPNEGCPFKAEGSINMSVVGGTSPYSYTWSNGYIGEDPIGLANGNYTVTVIDGNGCSLARTVSIAVNDNISPVVLVKPVTVFLDVTGSASISIADVDNGTFDNCELESLSLSKTLFTCSDVGLNYIELIAIDKSGNMASAVAEVRVIDQYAPFIQAHNVVAVLDENGVASISALDIAAGSFDNCSIANISLDKTTFDCSQLGANDVTLTVVDNSGNVASATATVIVVDQTAPFVQVRNTVAVLDENGIASISVADIVGETYDNCSVANISLDKTAFDCSQLGTNDVTLTVIDNSGNVSTVTATVTVVDQTAPYVQVRNAVAVLDENGSASISVADIVGETYDNCSVASISLDKTAFDCSQLGVKDVTLTVIDNSGNVATATATVTVIDQTAPFVQVRNAVAVLDENGVASISIADVDAGSFDNCSVANISLDKTIFDCSHLGTNNVTFTVIDNSGNVATATATVTVVDQTAPFVQVRNAVAVLDENGVASISIADVDAGSFDNCSVANISLDKTTFDCSLLGANDVTLTVVDNSGNVASATATVTVVDQTAPKLLNASADFTVISNPTDCDPQVYWTIPTVEEACPYTLVGTHTPGDEFQLGTTEVVYTVTDASGNFATVTTLVTVQAQPLVSAISQISEYAGGYNISCAGLADGSASVSVDGGCLPYSYFWSDGQRTADARNLVAGTYSVTATDANGTETVVSVTLVEPSVLQAELTSPIIISGYNTSCNVDGDGSAVLTVEGGVAPFTVAWSNGETNTFNISGLNAGIYSASVSDLNGCAVAVSIELTKPEGCNCYPAIPAEPTTCASCVKVIDGKQWVNIGANDVATVLTSYNSGVNFQQGTLVIRGTANIPSLNLNAGDSVIVLGNLTVGGINLNNTSAVFLNFGTVTVNGWSNLNGTLTNYGQLKVTNGLNINEKGALINSGNAEITASFNLNGSLENNGYIKIPGTVYANSNADLVNNCTFEIGTVTINTTRTFKNNGTFTAKQKLVLNNTLSYFGAGSITSLANFTANNASLNNVGASCNLIEISNISTFNGGRANGPIAICDVSGIDANNNLYLQNGAGFDCEECAYMPSSVLKSSVIGSEEANVSVVKPVLDVYPAPVAVGTDVYVTFGTEPYTLNVVSTLGVTVYSVAGAGTIIVPASKLGTGSFVFKLNAANGVTDEETVIVE